MTISYDATDSTYKVTAFGREVKTTVTHSGDIAANWIRRTFRIHRECLLRQRELHHLTVGLDIEWCPHNFHGTRGENPPALLQLCIGRRCLVFQLLHCREIPHQLSGFLSDDRFCFVGVGIKDDIDKLQNAYGLEVQCYEDLRYRAAECSGFEYMRQWGLSNLVQEYMGERLDKPRRIRLSNWGAYNLTLEQMEYAATDAIASYELGRHMYIGYFSD